MTNFRQGAGAAVAADVRGAVSAIDGALLNQHRMAVSILEMAHGSDVPVGETQKLYGEISSGIAAFVEGRGRVVSAVRRMTALKNGSNIRMEDYGCPDGWSAIPRILTGEVSQTEIA